MSRDRARTPMQWSGDSQAGFTDHSATWLPVHTNYNTNNVKVRSHHIVSPYMECTRQQGSSCYNLSCLGLKQV